MRAVDASLGIAGGKVQKCKHAKCSIQRNSVFNQTNYHAFICMLMIINNDTPKYIRAHPITSQ